MKTIVFPGTDLRISALSLGSTEFGTAHQPESESFALMDEFVALGGNFIDTAHVYSNWIPGTLSRSEKTIGRWLQANGMDKHVVVGTKGAHPELHSMHVSRLSPAEIQQDVQESLDFLQLNKIDLYWLHRDAESIPVSEIIDTMNEMVRSGKIRYFGCSNWKTTRIQAALDYSASKGLASFVANQPMWSIAVPQLSALPDQTLAVMDEAGQAFHRQNGMPVVAYSSQARGFFTKLAANQRERIAASDLAVFDHPVNHRRLATAQNLAAAHEVTLNDVVLSYLLSQPFPTIPVIGSHTVEQLRNSVQAMNLALTTEELAALESERATV